jgi:hypothetical protein
MKKNQLYPLVLMTTAAFLSVSCSGDKAAKFTQDVTVVAPEKQGTTPDKLISALSKSSRDGNTSWEETSMTNLDSKFSWPEFWYKVREQGVLLQLDHTNLSRLLSYSPKACDKDYANLYLSTLNEALKYIDIKNASDIKRSEIIVSGVLKTQCMHLLTPVQVREFHQHIVRFAKNIKGEGDLKVAQNNVLDFYRQISPLQLKEIELDEKLLLEMAEKLKTEKKYQDLITIVRTHRLRHPYSRLFVGYILNDLLRSEHQEEVIEFFTLEEMTEILSIFHDNVDKNAFDNRFRNIETDIDLLVSVFDRDAKKVDKRSEPDLVARKTWENYKGIRNLMDLSIKRMSPTDLRSNMTKLLTRHGDLLDKVVAALKNYHSEATAIFEGTLIRQEKLWAEAVWVKSKMIASLTGKWPVQDALIFELSVGEKNILSELLVSRLKTMSGSTVDRKAYLDSHCGLMADYGVEVQYDVGSPALSSLIKGHGLSGQAGCIVARPVEGDGAKEKIEVLADSDLKFSDDFIVIAPDRDIKIHTPVLRGGTFYLSSERTFSEQMGDLPRLQQLSIPLIVGLDSGAADKTNKPGTHYIFIHAKLNMKEFLSVNESSDPLRDGFNGGNIILTKGSKIAVPPYLVSEGTLGESDTTQQVIDGQNWTGLDDVLKDVLPEQYSKKENGALTLNFEGEGMKSDRLSALIMNYEESRLESNYLLQMKRKINSSLLGTVLKERLIGQIDEQIALYRQVFGLADVSLDMVIKDWTIRFTEQVKKDLESGKLTEQTLSELQDHELVIHERAVNSSGKPGQLGKSGDIIFE